MWLEFRRVLFRSFVRINVVDSGIGIKEENVEKIFNRFYQVSNSDTSASIGTGIGLHLTKTLVEMHHGEIICRNNDSGPGACFSIVLPLGNDHLESSQMVAPDDIYTPQRKNMPDEKRLVCNDDEQKQRSKTKYKVLIVEDDEEIRKYLRSELSADFHISECSDGKEGFTHILKNLPDLVISDIMMPELDGISLCQKIKKNININHIPVVLLTAKTDSTDQIEGLKTGADAYVTKPFNIEMLRITMHNILKNRDILKNNFNGSQNQEEKVEKIELKSSDEKLMERIMSVINKNISDSDLNVEMIASEVGISRVHLHRKLKELTNQSTRDFLRNIRLKQAAELLSEKNIAIADVAYATGFTNLAHFSTKFKEVYGVSPKEYMKDTKEELAEVLID